MPKQKGACTSTEGAHDIVVCTMHVAKTVPSACDTQHAQEPQEARMGQYLRPRVKVDITLIAILGQFVYLRLFLRGSTTEYYPTTFF